MAEVITQLHEINNGVIGTGVPFGVYASNVKVNKGATEVVSLQALLNELLNTSGSSEGSSTISSGVVWNDGLE